MLKSIDKRMNNFIDENNKLIVIQLLKVTFRTGVGGVKYPFLRVEGHCLVHLTL